MNNQKEICVLVFLFLAKWLSQSFDRTILRRKGRGRGLVVLQFFWLLKKAIRTFNFIYKTFY